MSNRANRTDRLVAAFPEGSAARQPSSVVRQFLEPIGAELDRSHRDITDFVAGQNPQTANVIDPDWLYAYELSVDEDFNRRELPSGKFAIITPTVRGQRDGKSVTVNAVGSAEDLNTDLATDMHFEQLVDSFGQLTPTLQLSEVSSWPAFNNLPEQNLWFWLSDVAGAVDLEDGLDITQLKVTGYTRGGHYTSEFIPVLINGVIRSRLKWRLVESIESIGILPASGQVSVHSWSPSRSEQEDPVYRDLTTGDAERIIYRHNPYLTDESPCMEMLISQDGRASDIIRSVDTRDSVKRIFFADSTGTTVRPLDVKAGSRDGYFYGLDQNRLYAWEKLAPLPDLSDLEYTVDAIQQFDVEILVEPAVDALNNLTAVYQVALDEPKTTDTIDAWYWKLTTPNTAMYEDANGDFLATNDAPYWKYLETPISRFGINDECVQFSVTEFGQYSLQLVCRLTSGAIETTTRVFFVEQRTAVLQVDLPVSMATGSPSVTLSANNEVFINDGASNWQAFRRFDYFAIDDTSKRILMRENYAPVEVQL